MLTVVFGIDRPQMKMDGGVAKKLDMSEDSPHGEGLGNASYMWKVGRRKMDKSTER